MCISAGNIKQNEPFGVVTAITTRILNIVLLSINVITFAITSQPYEQLSGQILLIHY